MKTQTPAEGIMKTNDWGDGRVYRVACTCGSAYHDHHVWVEAEGREVTVTVYTNATSNWWSKTRWHAIWTLLTQGYITTESTVVMTQQQALNYAATLEQAVADLTQKD
jgi:hypothetical protein